MTRLCFTLWCLFMTLCSVAQTGQHYYSGDKARSAENPLYWKNRAPDKAYWQQDVQYAIKAEINDSTDIIDGSEQLTYFNNSPDTLTFVYFHLYQNAFQPDSYLDELTRSNEVAPNYSKYESEKLGTVVDHVKNEGQALKMELDNTILKVYLSKPLMPDASVTFDIKFKTYYGTGDVRRRMKFYTAYGYKHYNGVQWFPKISVYDRKFGWTADQHMNREFYGDFGTYDVELTFPDNYIVEATGMLTNKSEAMPDSLRKKLDMKNFQGKQWESAPSIIIPRSEKKKTWKYHADNVHDFAFTADPTYRIGEVEWNGVKCIAIAQEPHAGAWQNAAEYTAKIIKTYSEDFGMYAYPKIIVADARDGMEYPMITLDGGSDPGYRGLFCHEVGHNWFYGMVGNNETYRPALDEGFTQFLTAWSMKKLEGDTAKPSPSGNKYVDHFSESQPMVDRVALNGYLNSAIRGTDGFINTHSDKFNGALGHGGGYSMVYYKTAAMLYNLQYVLGDSLFLHAMQHYFNQWKICHPYFEDFRNSIIHYTHTDLNWFFDQWMETDKRIDYAVQCIKPGDAIDDYVITFRRKERMEMPVDFSVYSKDGVKYDYHIPNRNFIKQTTATVLPKWFGWDKLNETYEAKVHIPGGIETVRIDTIGRLMDINMLNNSKPTPVISRFDSKIYNSPDRYNYLLKVRPDVWYNNYDGFKAGFHVDGNYFNYSHFVSLDAWINTGFVQANLPDHANSLNHDPFSFLFTYRTPTEKLVKNSAINLNAKWLDGLQAFSGGFDVKTRNDKNKFYFNFLSLYRADLDAKTYLLYPDEWQSGKYNNSLNVGVEHTYDYVHGNGDIDLSLRSSSLGSNYDYSFLTLSAVNRNAIGKFDFSTRVFMQYGSGTSFADESRLYLAGGNGEDLMNDKFTRSRAFVPQDWLGYGATTNHFQQGGGLNLRGYAGYVVAQSDAGGNIRYIYKGTSGASVSGELAFDRLFNIRPNFTRKWLHFTPYLFGDAGVINYDSLKEDFVLSDIRADAGAGIAMTIKKFGPLQTVKPFIIRIDFPFLLNRPSAQEPDYFKYRWVVGIGRTF